MNWCEGEKSDLRSGADSGGKQAAQHITSGPGEHSCSDLRRDLPEPRERMGQICMHQSDSGVELRTSKTIAGVCITNYTYATALRGRVRFAIRQSKFNGG